MRRALLLAVVLASPLAAAQALDLAPEPPLGAPLPLEPGAALRLNVTVTNPTEEGLVVLLAADAPAGWNATVAPASFDLPPRAAGATRTFTLLVAAPERAPPAAYEVTVRLAAANSTTGTAFTQLLDVPLQVTHSALVLGVWENPLPPPLDNAYGVFLLNLGFWAAIAGLLILLQDPIVKWLTRKAEKHVTARIVTLLRKPVFYALVFFGLLQSWRALPPAPWVDGGLRVLGSLYILVLMYLVYKAFRAVLLYYAENVAARTETQLDDILVPVLEKVGAVVIVAGGFLYFIGTLGIDLTAFVAGGVVVSMVLAFAAQDTLSNFFAGVFLMLDRPFLRGDDIMLTSGQNLAGDVFRVEQVGLRSTRLYHHRNHQVVVMPNNELAKNPVVNLMHPDANYRLVVDVDVAYGTDVARVRDILLRIAAEHPLAVADARFAPAVSLEAFGESALRFRLLFFIEDARRRLGSASDVRMRILEEFERAGIQIPFPQRVVRLVHDGEGSPGALAEGGPRARDVG